jgi:hypothetical protein
MPRARKGRSPARRRDFLKMSAATVGVRQGKPFLDVRPGAIDVRGIRHVDAVAHSQA